MHKQISKNEAVCKLKEGAHIEYDCIFHRVKLIEENQKWVIRKNTFFNLRRSGVIKKLPYEITKMTLIETYVINNDDLN